MAEMLDASVHDVSADSSGRLRSYLSNYSPRCRSDKEHVGIFLARSGHGARKFIPAAKALGGFTRSLIWILDSFWTDASREERRSIDRHFDLVGYTQAFDGDFYRKLFGDRAICLEWGSDVLDLGGAEPHRDIDLLRLGRQPPSWEDDGETNRASAARGLRFAGRPPMRVQTASELMRQYYNRTKFTLAHSNVAAPAPYTHPTKAYITGRWADALACGVTVAGTPPEGDLALLDWPEALLRVPCDDRDVGLDIIVAATSCWTPDVARRNHLGALRKLDWRWRFRKLVDALAITSPRLDQSVNALEERIASVADANR